MNCSDVQNRLLVDHSQQWMADRELRTHLKQCGECREFVIEDLRVIKALRSLPVLPASQGFADRALMSAWRSRNPAAVKSRQRFAPWVAAAASVVLAVCLVLLAPWRDQSVAPLPELQVVAVAPDTVRLVDVMMVSGQALPNATITVHLDDNVALQHYTNTKTLSWQTPIKSGSNKLTLPVQLLNENSGNIRIEIQAGDARKEMRLLVQPQQSKPVKKIVI